MKKRLKKRESSPIAKRNKKRNSVAAGMSALALLGVMTAGTAFAADPTSATPGATDTTSISGKVGRHMGNYKTMDPVKKAAREAAHKAIEAAITANDYTAFKAATATMAALRPAGAPSIQPEITQTVFDKMVQANKLRAVGDKAGAKKIMTEIGFKGGIPGMGGKHDHKGMRQELGYLTSNLTDTQKQALKNARPFFQAGKHDEAVKLLQDAGINPPEKNN